MIQERWCKRCGHKRNIDKFNLELTVCDTCVKGRERKLAYNRNYHHTVRKGKVKTISAPILKSWGYLTGQIADSGDWNRVGRSPDA